MPRLAASRGLFWLLAAMVLALPLTATGCMCAAEPAAEPAPADAPAEPEVDQTEESAWTKQTSGISEQLNDVFFINENIGWAVGDDVDSAPYGESNVLKTTDGGATWEAHGTGSLRRIEAVHFIDESTGYCVAWASQVFKSTDGGESWEQLEHDFASMSDHFYDVFFIDENTGWAVGGFEMVMFTADGGETWVLQEVELDSDYDVFPAGIHFIDENTGWVVGAFGILATTDGGGTWAQQDDRGHKGIEFVNGQRGWAVGDAGLITSTVDGGRTWVEERPAEAGGSGLRAVRFVDAETGGGVGDGGLILRY
jgi:photosystem II stability/assembly factor-like uncharacterized protein